MSGEAKSPVHHDGAVSVSTTIHHLQQAPFVSLMKRNENEL